MAGEESGLEEQQLQLQQDLMMAGQALNVVRVSLGLTPADLSQYTPQVGQQTMAAHAELLQSIESSTPEGQRAEALYARISPHLPAGYKAQLDGNAEAKAAFLQSFMNAQTYVTFFDQYYAAIQQAEAEPNPGASASTTTYSAPQIQALREAMVLVSTSAVPATFSQADAQGAATALKTNARQVAASLQVAAADMSDVRIGQAILDKLAAERAAYFAAHADATQGQFKTYMRETYNIQDIDAVSKVGLAMKNVAASGAFSVTPPANTGGTETRVAQEIVPDAATRQAMDRIRTQIFPLLDITPSGTDNAAFRRDFARASTKLATLFEIQGDVNSPAVRQQIMAKIDELAAHPDLGTLRAAAESGSGAFRFALGIAKPGAFDRLPQAIQNDPMKLFQLLDNRAQLRSSLDQVYASNILAPPQVVVARTGDDVAQPETGGNTGDVQTGQQGGDANAELAQAQQLMPQVRALATAVGLTIDASTMPNLGQALAGAIAQERNRYFSANGTATEEQFYQNLSLRTGIPELNADKLQAMVQAATVVGASAAASGQTTDANRIGPKTVEEASQIVETVLIQVGGAVSQMGGGGGGALGGLNLASLAGFTPPERADGTFDEQSQHALHMALMGLKKLGGDDKADGSYSAEIGQTLLRNIVSSEAYAMVRQQFGITEAMSPEDAQRFASDPEAYLREKFPPKEVSGRDLTEAEQQKKAKLESLVMFFRSLDKLNEENKLNNEAARDVTFMGTIMEKIGEFLPDSFKNFLRDFFENDQFGKMIGGVLAMFGFPVHKLWGGQAPGSEAVRQEVRDGYRRELEEAGFDHAELKRRIMDRLDDSLAFKAAERLLFHGADRGTIRRELEAALDRAAQETDPDRAADVFADELIRRGEQYQSLTPEQREEFVRQAREAYESDVRTMSGVPTDGQTPEQRAGGTDVRTAAGVPNYSAAQLQAVSGAMTLAGISVPASGLTAAGAKVGIDQIHAETTRIATALGLEVTNANYDGFGRRVQERIAEERTKFFGDNADATEGQFKEHMRTLGIEDLDKATKYAQAFTDIHASGAMNLGVAPGVSVNRTQDGVTAEAADGVTVEADGKRYEIVFNPNATDFIQGPTRYSFGRVAVLQNILSQNSAALEMTTAPAEYMKGSNGAAPDMMTRNTCMALEELLVRAQLDKGVEVGQISHRYDDTTMPIVADYMRSKGMNEQDITRFMDNVRDLRADMKSTNPRDRNAGADQAHSVWDQSYIHNQVDVKVSNVPAPVVAEDHAEDHPEQTGPVDRYPGIHMSPQNELPPGMTVEQAFERYREFNKDKNDPNCAPLIFQHEGKAYAGLVEEATNTFRVIELEGYLDPNAPSYRALSNSDYNLLHDNYNWRNGTPAGIIAYVDKQLCLEPLTVTAEVQPEQEERPRVTVEFNNRGNTSGIPQTYWDLPKLSDQDLAGLDRGCIDANELSYLYERAVGTQNIPDGGALLTPLNGEDSRRLGGDMIISVRNTRSGELEHRLVNFDVHKLKIGNVTENYSPSATIRRLDDFLDTQYDAMAMTIPVEAAKTRVSSDYARDHKHTVEDALQHLYDPSASVRSYDRLRARYVRGDGNEGEGGYQTRWMYRHEEQAERSTYGRYYRPVAEHDHGACNGPFNDRATRSSRGDDNDGFSQPKQYPAAWGHPINTFTTLGAVMRHKWGGGNDEVSQNARDCHVSSPYDDPVQVYERGDPRVDSTPGVIDQPPR